MDEKQGLKWYNSHVLNKSKCFKLLHSLAIQSIRLFMP